MVVDYDDLRYNGISVRVFERQKRQLRCLVRANPGDEGIVVSVEQLDQNVIATGRITCQKLRDDHVVVIGRRSEKREVLSRCIFIPGPTLEAQVNDGVDICEREVCVGIEQQVDAVKVTVTVMVVEQYDISRIEPEIGIGGLRCSRCCFRPNT